MGVKFKPLYSCDGCGEDHEDPDKVRIFESIVKSGDESKQYIKSGMFCLSCIPLALDFENKVPETVQIVDPKKALADAENLFEKQYEKILNKLAQDNYITFGIQDETSTEREIRDIKAKLVEIERSLKLSITPTQESMEDQILREEARNFVKHGAQTIPEKEFKETIKTFIKNQESLPADWPSPSELVGKEDLNSLKHGDELTEKYVEHITSPEDPQETTVEGEVVSINGEYIEPQTTSQEPETTTENINSETEEDAFESIGEDHGKYLILRLIDEEISERKFAQKNGYKDTKDLREACGLKSLIGLYYSTNKYTNTPTDFIVEPYEDQKIINKMFFGVPNIVKRNIFVARELNIALIEKDLFADKIESISFEVPETIKSPEVIIPKGEENLVPNISKDKLKSFVSDAAKTLNETKPNVYKEQETGFREMKEEAIRTGKPVITATQKKIFSRDKIGDDYI